VSTSTTDALVLPVRSVTYATPATRVVRLDLGGRAFPYEAGQATCIGVAERFERVPYSIASAPAESARHGGLDFLIKIEPSGRWGHQFDGIMPGMRLGILPPSGAFVLPKNSSERQVLFVAGGTGIAPIRALIAQAVSEHRPGRMKLLYSAKTVDDFAYLPELEEMARHDTLQLRLHITREAPPDWPGERGRIGSAQLAPLVDDPATLCYVCGPKAMVDDVPPMLLGLGIDRTRIRLEDW
jgi:NAD(P)H-flavin reductase